METKEQNLTPLIVEVYPEELIQGDNQITIAVLNQSQDIYHNLVIHLTGDNLFFDSASTLLVASLESGEMMSSLIELTASNIGAAVLEIRCNWKQQNKIFDYPVSFQLLIKEGDPKAANLSGETNIKSTYLRDYYLNTLPKWQKLLLQKEMSLNHLREQAAMWGGEWKAPVEIVHQIKSLENEVSDLLEKIEEGEAYLNGFR